LLERIVPIKSKVDQYAAIYLALFRNIDALSDSLSVHDNGQQ
jgi:hypothetical protein